ncbi:MAG: A24 family peptidase [Vicinamibacterales bacterium]
MTVADGVALLVAGVACVTDLRSARIPNVLTFGAISAGLLFHVAAPIGAGASEAALGLAAGLLVFFPLFALNALGAGDVKLMAALGTWLGWRAVLSVALYGAVAGGVMALGVALWHGYLRRALGNLRTLAAHWVLVGIKPLPELTLDAGRGLLPAAMHLPIFTGLLVTLWQH